MPFVDKTVLITGAGGGIGKATAKGFANKGASVAVNDIDKRNVESTVEEIRSEGGIAISAFGDITSKKTYPSWYRRLRGILGISISS